MSPLTLVAGAPARPTGRRDCKQPLFQPVLLHTLGSAFMAGEMTSRLARAVRGDVRVMREQLTRLLEKLEMPELRDHPKRAAAVERMMDLSGRIGSEEIRAKGLEEFSAARRGQMVYVWSRLSPEAAAIVEEEWGTRARTPAEFVAWVDRMWAAETGQTVEGFECPF